MTHLARRLLLSTACAFGVIVLLAATTITTLTTTTATITTVTGTNVDASARLTMPAADLVVGTCTVNTQAVDTGGATLEFCVCGTTNVFACWKLTDGTFNANGPVD